MRILVEAGWVNAKELLDIEAELADVPPSFAMEALRKQVEDFAFLINEREQTALNDTLDRGLAEGWTPKRLKQEIAQTFAEGYHVTNEAGEVERVIPPDSWLEMVARTELNRAQTAGQVALYNAAGVQKVEWVTTGGADVCDICEPADGDVVNLGDVFESVNVDAPPAHPRCNCALMAADDDIRGR